jgi:fatty-acid peroxygenase
MDIVRDTSFDSTAALLQQGYEFIPRRCRELETDVFETRLTLRRAVCALGADAARMFYEPGRFTRKGALPPTALMLLQDLGSVQRLEDEAHHVRKALFMRFMTPESLESLATAVRDEWDAALERWSRTDEIVLHHEVEDLLTRAACRWCGVPLEAEEAPERAREFGAMIDGAGAVGPRAVKGLWLRRRTERWAQRIVSDARAGRIDAPTDSALAAIVAHRDLDGGRLDTASAGVELLNFLRPTVAIARYVTFAAVALAWRPACAEVLRSGDPEYPGYFAQEVRRFFPFFPLVGGRAREEFEWRGHRFEEDAWLLLSIYGTNRDPRLWREPDAFEPERFRDWRDDGASLIPQGGGDADEGHRCPADAASIEVVKAAALALATGMRYEVPAQDLRISLSRMPAIPESRVILRRVRPAPGGAASSERPFATAA